MEAQAQWAGKLLQEYQRRAEASGFPGPHPEGPPSTKDTAAKTAQGMKDVSIGHLFIFWPVNMDETTRIHTRKNFYYIKDNQKLSFK